MVVRSVVTALGILLIGRGVRRHHHPVLALFLFWVVSVSVVFGLLGIIIGLWAKNFEQLNILNVFFIDAAVDGGRRVQHHHDAAALAALARLRPIRSSISSTACATP